MCHGIRFHLVCKRNVPEVDAYVDREQTEAKHFILKGYLQELAFKVMHHWDIAYIDGFSGPWESKTEDFSDTSFMIAIEVLMDAQRRIAETSGCRRTVKCYFAENDPEVHAKLQAAVASHHRPSEGFEVRTFFGNFEDAVTDIRAFAGTTTFPLIFIDPTGWTGYPLSKIAPLFAPKKCEVLVNFMYDFVNRAAAMRDPKILASLDPILGGPGWSDRLDPLLDRGLAVEKLFRETLKSAGGFAHVISTKIEKNTADRPHFYLAYGTKDRAGLKAFREIEFKALKKHALSRAGAKERKREQRTKTKDMFADHHAGSEAQSVEEIVADQKLKAASALSEWLRNEASLRFARIVDRLLEEFMLRETNVKDICVELASKQRIRNTWGSGRHKPSDDTLIERI